MNPVMLSQGSAMGIRGSMGMMGGCFPFFPSPASQ